MSSLYPAAVSLTGNLVVVAGLAAVASLFSAGVGLALFDELMDRIHAEYGVTFTALDDVREHRHVVAPLLGAAIAGLSRIRMPSASARRHVVQRGAVRLGHPESPAGRAQKALRQSSDAPINPGGAPAADDHAGLDHGPHPLEAAEVRERIAVDQQQVRALPDLDRPDLALEAERAGGDARRALERGHR